MAPRLRLLCPLLAALACAAPAHAATGSGGAVAAGEPSAPTATGGATPAASAPSPVAATAASGGASPDAPAPAPAPAPLAGLPTDVPIAAATGPIIAADVPHGPLIAVTARRHGISASLLTALVWQESGFRPRARSSAGARGLTQLMPATARELGVRRSYDPAQNVDGGARYLRAQLVRFGSAALALAAYNAGPGAVVKHRGIPPFRETRQYVRNVLTIEARLRAAGVR